jgi:hypothetical protein
MNFRDRFERGESDIPEAAKRAWNADRSRGKSISALNEARPKPKRP